MKYLLSTFLFLSIIMLATAQAPHENHQIYGINKEGGHAHFFPFENEILAHKGKKENSSRFQSLNGLWKFHWTKNPANKPKDF